ncbi:hypothetical protein [Sporosarcina sp. FA9]|uniref:hypothetical protein n=1 Tax=Sporosarcina sp. FA9 TaxID=3413030 RepID=UPI003F65DE36
MLKMMELNPARARFINDFFEKYLTLTEEEEEELMREISHLENAEEFTKLPNSWEERGIRKGIEQGKEALVLKMLAEGLSIDVISKVTDLDKETIMKLKG